MDLTLKNTSQNQYFNRTFAEKPVFYDTKSTCLPRLGLVCPKVVSGHNLDHMAPFSNPRPGFCMVFRYACFWFWVPGTHFWTPEPKFGPGISKFGPGWPGEVFGPKLGTRKMWFCLGLGSIFWIVGFPVTQMDCMVPRRCLGEAVSPQTPPKNGFWGISPIWGNFGGWPLASCVSPIGPLWTY